MLFVSRQIKGKGRGKPMGVPTINLIIPQNFSIADGVYAVKVIIEKKSYIGAMHYGPIPVFGEVQKSLEIFLLDVTDTDIPSLENVDITVSIVKYLREIRNFPNPQELVKQIDKDVEEVRSVVQ